jgi:hypothetical protein
MPNQKISELPHSDILYVSQISGNEFYIEELSEQEKVNLINLHEEEIELLQDISSLQVVETSVESNISSLQVTRELLEATIDGFIPSEEQLAELNQLNSDITSLNLVDADLDSDISSLQFHNAETRRGIDNIELKTADRHYLLIARENYRNERISFKNLHRSVLDKSVYLKSDQRIEGEKTFTEQCTIKKRSNFTEIKDISIDGPISGHSFFARTGFFQNSLSSFPDFYPNENIIGSTLCEQNLNISGFFNLSEDLQKEQSLNIKNLKNHQNCYFASDITGLNNLYSQNLTCRGNASVKLNLDCHGDIYSEDLILFPNNKKIDFSYDRLNFTDNFSFLINIDNQSISIKENFLTQNSTVNIAATTSDIDTEGSLNIIGNTYIDKIYTKYNDEYKPIIAGADESIQFRAQVLPNQQLQKIYFPKTFHNSPVVHCTLENPSGTTDFSLLQVSTTFIEIKLNSITTSNDLYINILACSPSEYSPNKDSIVRFTTPLYATNYFLLGFPTVQDEIPIILNQLEGDIITEYAISSVTKSGFAIRFADTIPTASKLHTILTLPKTQKLN